MRSVETKDRNYAFFTHPTIKNIVACLRHFESIDLSAFSTGFQSIPGIWNTALRTTDTPNHDTFVAQFSESYKPEAHELYVKYLVKISGLEEMAARALVDRLKAGRKAPSAPPAAPAPERHAEAPAAPPAKPVTKEPAPEKPQKPEPGHLPDAFARLMDQKITDGKELKAAEQEEILNILEQHLVTEQKPLAKWEIELINSYLFGYLEPLKRGKYPAPPGVIAKLTAVIDRLEHYVKPFKGEAAVDSIDLHRQNLARVPRVTPATPASSRPKETPATPKPATGAKEAARALPEQPPERFDLRPDTLNALIARLRKPGKVEVHLTQGMDLSAIEKQAPGAFAERVTRVVVENTYDQRGNGWQMEILMDPLLVNVPSIEFTMIGFGVDGKFFERLPKGNCRELIIHGGTHPMMAAATVIFLNKSKWNGTLVVDHPQDFEYNVRAVRRDVADALKNGTLSFRTKGLAE